MTMSSPRPSGSEPVTDPEYACQLGAALRAIREQRSWSLRDVQVASEGRFTASAVGTYERGERGISVQRLSELAQLYGVPLDRLLPENPSAADGGRGTNGASDADEKVMIDLVALERQTEPELETIRRYIEAIKLRRGDYNGRVISVRDTDVWAWAAASSVDPPAFLRTLDRLE